MSARTLRLSDLLAPWLQVPQAEDTSLSGLSLDSGRIEAGMLFVALGGERHHGLEFLEQACERGAAAVLAAPAPEALARGAAQQARRAGIPLYVLPELRERLSALAGRFYGEPSQALALLGVTGTDGKTTVSQFIAQALSDETRPCGVIGTLGYGLHGMLQPATHTTPDAIRVQALLAAMREQGARHAAMEVSSHALAQARVAGLHFQVAVLTNLTRDHLDYHGTLEAYAEAKAALFRFPALRCVVLNHDDAFGRRLARELENGPRVLSYSLEPSAQADIVCTRLALDPAGLRLAVRTPGGEVALALPLIGRFNAANVLACLGALLGLGLAQDEVVQRLQRLQPVAGRMQRVGEAGAPLVLVDYAHTPAALEAALKAVREHVRGRVWCVFGCGGERDRGKRSQMGAVAQQYADELVITDDNPRREDPQRIIDEILAGLDGREAAIVRDRAAAIRHAIARCRAEDAVLIAGKGHELEQIVGEQRLPFDDRAVAAAALRERLS